MELWETPRIIICLCKFLCCGLVVDIPRKKEKKNVNYDIVVSSLADENGHSQNHISKVMPSTIGLIETCK